jgi:cell division protein FtsX
MLAPLSGCAGGEMRPEDRPENLLVTVFLATDATEAQTKAVEQRLRAVPDAAGLRFVDHAAAYEKMKTMYEDSPDLLDSVKPEQLPASFEFNLPSRAAFERTYQGPLRADLRQLPGVDSVVFRGKPMQAPMSKCVMGIRSAPASTVPDKREIDVFLTKGATSAGKQAIEARVRAIPGAAGVTFQSKEESYARAKDLFKGVRPNVVASGKPEDMPEVLSLTMVDRKSVFRANDDRVDEQLCRMIGVDHVLIPPTPVPIG